MAISRGLSKLDGLFRLGKDAQDGEYDELWL
jgi:hypothetical protein